MTAPGRETSPWQPAGLATVTGMLAVSELKPGDLIAERYRIVRLLGMGAMGVVFQAHDVKLDVQVALKLLRPELASKADAFDRFRQELLLARQVSSPHVVRIHDLVQHQQAWLISMDYVSGQSLERLLGSEGQLPLEQALKIIRQMALGLAVAHQRGVVHRDLKPANVLIDEHGNALITDFGVARSVGATGLTASGVVVGTPAYLSPEQAQALPVDGRSDLYALGLILHELLTGKLPFAEGTPSEMMIQRILQKPALISTLRADLPAWVVQLVARLLDPRRDCRLQSAEAVVAAIDARRVPRAAGGSRRQRRLVWLSALLVVGGVVSIAYVRWWRVAPPPAVVAAVVPVLDVAMLPVRSDAAATADLAAGIRRWLTDALIAEPKFQIAEVERVNHALKRLSFDLASAQRNRSQVATAVNASHLLEAVLDHDAKRWHLQIELRDPAAAAAVWVESIEGADEAALLRALPGLLQSLRQRWRLASLPALVAPTSLGLRALGDSDSALPKLAPADATEPVLAWLWWDRLSALDRAGDSVAAQAEAAEAKRALAGRTPVAARRTAILAAVILGEQAPLMTELETLAQAPADHRLRLLWARALADLGQIDRAQQVLDQLRQEDASNPQIWYLLGKFAYMQGDSRAAVEQYLPTAQSLATRLNERQILAATVNLLGLGYRDLGLMEPAIDSIERAIRLRHELKDPRGESASLQNLAEFTASLGQFERAQTALDRAQSLIAALGDNAAMAGLQSAIGVLQEERGDLAAALQAFRQALSLREAVGVGRLIGRSRLDVGFAYYQLGEFDNARAYWQQADELYGRLDDKVGRVQARQFLALAETALGGFDRARQLLEQSLRDAEANQMVEDRAVGLAWLAELERHVGRMTSALAHANTALLFYTKREDPRGTVELQLLRAAVFIDLADANAASTAISGLNLERIDNREQKALYAWRKGDIELLRQQPAAALQWAEQAVDLAAGAHSLGTELSARLLKIRALAASGQVAAAQRSLRQTDRLLASNASVPLRLMRLEVALQVDPQAAHAAYRESLAQLARLPGWGRAYRLHAAAASALAGSDPAAATAARAAALRALTELRADTPPAQQLALDAWSKAQPMAGAKP